MKAIDFDTMKAQIIMGLNSGLDDYTQYCLERAQTLLVHMPYGTLYAVSLKGLVRR